MSLAFRRGDPSDVPGFARLAAHSFPAVSASPLEWERLLVDSPHGGAETFWLGEEDGRLVAGCRLLQFRQWIAGEPIPVMGLSTVAISASDRRRGLAGRLTASALREARSRGDLASALYPFRDSFYRRLGYGMAGEVHQFLVPPSSLADHPGRERVTIATLPVDQPLFSAVYDRWAPTQTGQMERRGRAWESVWEDGTRHGAVYRDTAGDPAAYAVFRYTRDRLHGRPVLEIDEIAWLDREARLAMYGWLASLSDQWGAIVYRAHPDEAFVEHLSDLRRPVDPAERWHFWFPVATAMCGPMFRVLDVEGAWSARRVRPEADLTVALEVDDAEIPENRGDWTLRMGGGRVEVVRGAATADVRISLGIEPLSRIFIGGITVSTALDAGLAVADRPDLVPRLDLLLAVPKPWTFDRF